MTAPTELSGEQPGGKPPWPAFEEVGIATLAEGLGCPAERLESYEAMIVALDAIVPTLVDQVAVVPDATFER